jgi:serine/threonine protein kinase
MIPIPIQPTSPLTSVLHDPLKRVQLAYDLIQSLKTLHDNGFVHRSIDRIAIAEVNGRYTFNPSDETAKSADIVEVRGFLGVHLAPERLLSDFTRRSWVEDDIYALGCVLLELAGVTLPWQNELCNYNLRQKFDQRAEDSLYLMANDPLLHNNEVSFVAFSMVHSQPEKRLASLDLALACLKRHLSWTLPELTSQTFDAIVPPPTAFYEKLAADLKDSKRKTSLVVAALLESHNFVNGFLPRKFTSSIMKVIYLLDEGKPLFLILPKKKRDPDMGTAKVGRAAGLIRQVRGSWKICGCFVLTSRKDEDPLYYKMSYPKEMALYKMVEGHGIFPQHVASFGFLKKPHKRLGIYEFVPRSLSTLIDAKQCTPEILQNVSQKVDALHKLGIAHRDIKPENVLVHSNGAVRLCDPDYAVIERVWKQIKSFAAGTPEYLPDARVQGEAGSHFIDDCFALVRSANEALPQEQQLGDEIIPLDTICEQLQGLTIKPPDTKCCVLC